MIAILRVTVTLGQVCLSTSLLALVVAASACSGVVAPVTSDSTTTQSSRAPKNWAIGILRGGDIRSLAEVPSCPNPRISRDDIPRIASEFVADPFLARHSGGWYLFFESFNRQLQKGEIAVATSRDLCHWSYGGTVLAAETHVSYPFVFKVGSTHYMIPESRQAGVIELYRAEKFPTRWTPQRVLVKGAYSDASLVQFQRRWWIFANRAPYGLAIFSASKLDGKFIEHPQSPLYLDDASKARPGGRPIVIDGALYRFVQDNREGYGKRVRLMRVLELSTTAFREEVADPDPFLQGAGAGWNGFGMHHVSAERLPDGSWVAAVDGNSW